MIKCVLLIALSYLAVSSTGAEDVNVKDFLVDVWLGHAHQMMTSTKNQQSVLQGMQFETKCGALFTWENCTVTADLGVVEDLSSIYRASHVTFTDMDNAKATVEFSMSFRTFGLHYPNMFVSGRGVKIEYKDIRVSPSHQLLFPVKINLDFSQGENDCVTSVDVSPPSSLPSFNATVQYPQAATLPVGRLSQVESALINLTISHLESLLNYEQICLRLVHLF